MSAESSGSSKSKDGLSLEQTSSPAPETDEVTGGKVDNACNNQAHSTTHCTQSQTNHTPILAHAQSTEGTNEVGTSCLDGLAKEGKQKDDLTSMTEEVSNLQQRHIEQSSHFEKICVIQSVNNEDSESSTESDDQSYELRLKAKEENQDKTFVIIYRRSENDPGDQSVEAVQVAKKVNHDNQRDTSDTTRRPKGNEQKGNDSGAIPRVRGVKLEQNNGCKVTDIYKRISENENDNDDEAMQRVEDGKHNQNNEFKDSEKRPSGNDIDDDGAMQSVEDGKLEQKYGNKNTEERPSGNEKDHDKRTKPSVKNENNGDNDIEKRPFKYEKNDKGNMKTKVVKEESPDINMKTNDTERESRENEKKYHPDNATQSALIKKRQRSEKSLKDNGSEQSQNEMSGNTNNDGEWTEGKKGRDKRRPTCKSGDPDMNPSNVNTDGTDSTISEQDDNGAMPGAVMLPIDNSRDSSVMKNKGLGQIAVTATDQESQTDFGKLEKELGETDKGTVENKGNDQEDETNLISQAGISEISDNTTSVLGYPAKNFDDYDGGNKEIKGKGALAKTTPNTQTDSQNENPPYCQDEAGAISSEPSREALSFSQRLDDDTLLDKQLDEFIDNISTGINENREEWKKSTRKKMKSFLLTKLTDGTFSQRSFDSCVTNNMPVQNFDSDNHITDVRGVKREQGAKGGPSSSQHSQANDPIKCTTEPGAEIPSIDSAENQGPPEQSTSQTEGAKSSHGKTSSTPKPVARKPPLSQSHSPKISTESSRQAGKTDTVAIHLNRSLNTGSSKKFPSNPEFLDIQWKSEQKTGGVDSFVIPLYCDRTIRYYIRISCLYADYYRLKFMFQNTNTIEDLSEHLSKMDCFLKPGTDEIYLGSRILQETSKVIRDKIEDIIINVTSTIHVHCTVVGFAKDNLVEKCKQISPECCKGNIAVYEQDEHVWIVGRDEKEIEILEKQLTDKNVLQKASYIFKDDLRIALGEKEKKFGPITIGSSDEIKEFEMECSRANFYKLYLIFDKTFLEKNDALFRSTGKVPIVILISSAVKKAAAGDWVDFALRDVESFVTRMLPLISAKCQKLSKTTASSIDLCKEKVVEYYDGDLQVYADEDDNRFLWFVSKDYHLIEKSVDILASEDLIEKTTFALPDHDHGSQLIAHPLTVLELGICMQFNISAVLKAKHEKYIKEIYIDKSKFELKIQIMNINGSEIRSDIKTFLRERMATRSIVRNIPNCCIPFLKIPAIRKEIDTKLPYYIDVQHDRCEAEVYSDTREHAKEVVCIIEGLFQQKKVVVEDFDTSSLILKSKVEEWRKEFSEKIGIELTTKLMEVWGLRPCVEQILFQLESYIQQQRKPPVLEVNVKDEPDQTCLLKQDFEGKVLIDMEKEVEILQTPAFKRRIKEIQEKHQCSIQIETENAYPLRKETSLGTQWQFQSGKNVVFNQTDVLDVETNRTDCIVQFIPDTFTIKPGAGILYEKASQLQNIMRVIVTIPIWRDGEYKEKEHLRNCILLLFQSLYDEGFSSVTIPLMIDSAIQWPERKLLNQILYLRRHFPETAVFCHPNKGNYEKLLPIFEDLTDKAEKKQIIIKIQKKRFTDMKVQVLVNTVGRDLKLEQGHVSNSILNVAGKEIQTEADRKCPNGLNRGEVLVTNAYNLRDRGILKVFHGSLLPWGGYESIATIKLFVAKCLNLATEYGMTSIAFPALGTGNLGYPHKSVAKAMFETVRSFMEGSVYTSVQEVVFNVFDEKSKEAFFTEEKKYLDSTCRSATFLPRIYKFPLNDLTFELYCGEVWTQDVKGLAVLYESNEMLDQDDKICIFECGKQAREFDKIKRRLQSGQVRVIKNKVSRPIEWVFHLYWYREEGLKTATATLNSAEIEKLDSMAFVISKKDAVAGQLPDIIKSVFAAAKQFKKGSFLKKVIFVVDPEIISVAYKTVEDPVFQLFDAQKQRCHVWFKCNTQNGLQNAKEEILSVLDSLSGATSKELYDYETSALTFKDSEKDSKSEKSVLEEKGNALHTQSLTQDKSSGMIRSAENCSLILSIVNKAFWGQDEDVTKQRLQVAVCDAYVPVKIIFPFLAKRDALLKFKTYEELGEFRKCFHHDYLQLKDFPEQAVTCLSATVSKTAKTRFFEQGWTQDDITERSGVAVKNQNGSLVLEGSLLEVQAAREFILNACQSKSPTRDIQNSAVIKNASLDYENSFVNEKTNIRTQNESLQPEKSNLETYLDTKKTDVVWKKDGNRKKNSISQNSSDFGNQTSSVIPEKLDDPSAFSAGSVKLQEPANLSMRQKEKLRIPHLDYAILETIFPLSTDITGKVVVNKNSEEFVEVLGTPETVQPFIETMKIIRVLQKIPIEIVSKDFSQIEKNFLFHQKNIHSIFPTAHILIYERRMFLIKPEDVDKAAVLDVLFSAREKRVAEERTKRIFKDQLQSSHMSSPSQQTTFGNPVLEKGDSRVYVVHGNVFSFDLYDCFVNPTNEFLNLEANGGLSAAVHKRAGEDVQKQCKIHLKSKKKLKVGDCVHTEAGNLKYKAIIHTVVEHWKNLGFSKYSVQTAMDHIKDVVIKCCELASKKKMTSIVFPAFGSGQSAIPSIILANGYRLGCKFLMHGKGSQQLKNIFFVIDNIAFLSLVEMTFRTPLPWCSYEPDDDEYTYHMPNLCSVVVAKRDVVHEKRVDALVVLETPSMSGNGKLASKVLKSAYYSYKHAKGNQQPGSALAFQYKGTLDYKTIVYIIMKNKWGAKDVERYKQCISNALSTSEGTSVSIAMKLFIGGTKDRELCMHLAKALTEAVVEYTESKESSLRRILILNNDPLRHELVKEEFHRYTKQSCKSNSYLEREVFINCDIPESETLV